jgi:hypothetical protein
MEDYMAGKSTGIFIKGKRAKRGERMMRGKGWRLVKVSGKKVFVGTLLDTIHIGAKRIAIFSVPT